MKKNNCWPWVILVILCLSQSAAIGITNNCIGLFLVPASAEFGCSIAEISLAVTLSYVFTCAALISIDRFLVTKFPMKYTMIGVVVLMALRSLLSFSNEVWQWWIICAVTGVGVSFISGFISSVVLERWFFKKLPTVLSIVAACSGIVGIIMSYCLGGMIETLGWRKALLFSNILAFAMVVPTLLLSLNPYEKHTIPYGATQQEYDGVVKTLTDSNENGPSDVNVPFCKNLLLLLFVCFNIAVITSFVSHLASFGTFKNVVFNASLVVTFDMMGNLFFKLTFGRIIEKFGLKKPAVASFVIILFGLVLMFFCKSWGILIGAFCYGASAFTYTSLIPLMGKQMFNTKQFPSVMQKSLVVYNIVIAFAGSLFGIILDVSGSYNLAIVLMFVLGLINIFLIEKSK